ncbi:hypothetical protein EFK50_00490 [Nocardioides marmoriginsengisoli]|uniref:Pentapeptide repeat-containing protein n=1 Tax=Nocardioides marmoriginsengisoli TaxID=661483 RepID=A0A3N0CT82_9ACTN|nr:hypothetical protein [Nocardioides marmoriginsengisoli]RNL66143.1 hypothetical protein EFK50_00490 [Nocardioides marmoriginsengisoli]
MKKSLKPRSTVMTVVVATVALILFGGGTAVAGGLITSAKIKNNTIQSIDVRNNALTGTDVRDGSLGSADVKDGSLTGADVKNGSLSHDDVGVYFATVESNAAVVDQSGGVTVSKGGTGTYYVDFHRDIRACAFSATVGTPGASSTTGQANVADRSGNANAVFLTTRTADGSAQADRGFHLIVVC